MENPRSRFIRVLARVATPRDELLIPAGDVSVGSHQESGTRGARRAQPVKRPTSARVVISQFVGSSPALGSMLTAQSLEPAWDSVSPSLSLSLPHSRYVSLCLSKMNKR